MNQDFVFNNSGTPTQAYVSPRYFPLTTTQVVVPWLVAQETFPSGIASRSCVSATPKHRFSSVQRPQFTPPSTSNNRGRQATPWPYSLPQAPAEGTGIFNPHKRCRRTAA